MLAEKIWEDSVHINSTNNCGISYYNRRID